MNLKKRSDMVVSLKRSSMRTGNQYWLFVWNRRMFNLPIYVWRK